MTPATVTTRAQAKKARLFTADAPATVAFYVKGTPEAKAAYLVAHLNTKSAQTVAAEQLRRGSRVGKLNKALAAAGARTTVEAIASGVHFRP